MISDPPTYQVIYSAIHQRCAHETRLSDYRISQPEDFPLINKSSQLTCSFCDQTHPATHIEIVKCEGLGADWTLPKVAIQEHNALIADFEHC